MEVIKFYRKPLLIISLLNLIILGLFGVYFDSYEGMISSIIQHTYGAPITNFWDSNVHFLLLYIYEKIVIIAPDYNIYGIVLVFYNVCILTFLGLVFYRILVVNLNKNNLFLFVFLYLILTIDSLVTVHTTRQAFFLIAAIFGLIESYKFELKKLSKTKWIFIVILIFFDSLLRFESVLLFSLIYIVLLLIHKRFTFSALASLLISSMVFFTFNYLISTYSSEGKKVFSYKEKEILIRDNVDYKRITSLQKLEVQALKQYFIADENHFKLDFYKSINKYPSSNGFLSIFDGCRFDFFWKTLQRSWPDILSSLNYIIFYFFTGFYFIIRQKFNNKQFIIQFVFLSLVPILLALHSVLALRFLIPFFAISAVINLILYLCYFSIDLRFFFICSVFILSVFYNQYNTRKINMDENKQFEIISKKLHKLDGLQQTKNPIIIYINFPNSYFPVKPLAKLSKQNVLFYNFYLFSSDEQHVKGWFNACHCNSLSIKDKTDYIVANQNLFVINQEVFNFLKVYVLMKYNLTIKKENIAVFDKDFMVCKLKYE